jgi:hypothetical protein
MNNKNYEVYKSNGKAMKICMKHTTVSKGWLLKLKGSQRLRVSNFGLKFWTRSLGKKCEMLLYYKLVQPTLAYVFSLQEGHGDD